MQSYTINSSKVIFLKKRPQSRQFKGSGNICTSCDRTLQEPYVHCSLECKVGNTVNHFAGHMDWTIRLDPIVFFACRWITYQEKARISRRTSGHVDHCNWTLSSSRRQKPMLVEMMETRRHARPSSKVRMMLCARRTPRILACHMLVSSGRSEVGYHVIVRGQLIEWVTMA